MVELRFHPDAVKEIRDSIKWYGEQSKTTERNFKKELDQSLQNILDFPLLSPKRYKTFRAYKLEKFPFLIVYAIVSNVVYVISIFHTSRNPDDLTKRINSL